jgi:hypothetical protein
MSVDPDNRHRANIKHMAASLANMLLEIDCMNQAIQREMDAAGDNLLDVMKDLKNLVDMRNRTSTACTVLQTKLGLSLAQTGRKEDRRNRLKAEETVAPPSDDFIATPGGKWTEVSRDLHAG